ncbi:MAG TPA: GNAT family N-acetyltransferase [Candidatus Polarisedimenticolia bacterium]|nr:GNAT family N-acetyltransferase [Candidatus Polarisedimenticolia bacterium]
MSDAAAIRPMRAEDAATVARLSGQLGYPAMEDEIRERFGRLADDPDSVVLVACGGDGGVRGWLHMAAPRDLVSPRYAEVRALIVDEPSRGRGVGLRLLEAAEGWARGRGFESIRVRSNIVRERARSFYERAGYRVTKTQHQFNKPLADRS